MADPWLDFTVALIVINMLENPITHTKEVTGILDSIDKYKKTPALSAVLL